MKLNAKVVQDLVVWGGALVMALLGSAQNMVWDSRPHRIGNFMALTAVLVAALKSVPDLPGSAPAQPTGDPTHA